MGMPVKLLMTHLDSRDVSEYMAFSKLEPFGSRQDDLRAGVIASTVFNSNPFRKKGSRTVQPKDFITVRSEPTFHKQSAEEIKFAFRKIAKRVTPEEARQARFVRQAKNRAAKRSKRDKQ